MSKSTASRDGDLEINEDIAHERLEWRLERIGWTVMALVLVAALAGLLGPGPLSSAIRTGNDSKLRLEYNRFVRAEGPTLLRIRSAADLATNGQLRLWIGREYIETVEIKHIDPEPASVEISGDRLIYVFKVSDPAQPTTVIFHLEPDAFGLSTLKIGIDEQTQLTARQFVYP